MKPSIDIGLFKIPSYPIAAGVGIIICLLLFRFSGIHFGISTKELCKSLVDASPWGFLGAVILGYTSKIPYFIEHDMHFWETISHAGIVFYGGLLGGLFGLWLYTFNTPKDMNLYLDAFAPLIPIFHAFGRIGCYLGGCCYGREYDGIGCVEYSVNGIATHRFPVQLVEAGACLILGCVLLYLVGRIKKGRLFRTYILSYAAIRFITEFFRGDEIRGIWFGLSTSQWISIGIAIVMLIRILAEKKTNRHGVRQPEYTKRLENQIQSEQYPKVVSMGDHLRRI